MSDELRIAAIQLTSGVDPAANLDLVCEHIEAASDVDLVVFPEATMACFGSDLAAVAQPLDGPWAQRVRSAAAKSGVTVCVGMFEPAGDGRVYNTVLITGPEVETGYRKIHRYDAFGSRESDTVAAGEDLVTVPVRGWNVGVATCFDLRFAEQFRALGRGGAQLVVVPASWGEGPGKAEQWDLLTRARATDSQSWLLACDQAWTAPRGTDPLGVGRSAVIDPLGRVRARLTHERDVLFASVDKSTVTATRERVPLW
jgi:predicted amidohydrolase